MRKSLWIAFMFVLTMVVPVRAYANPLDSFNDGFDTLLHPNTDVKVDDGLPKDYEPQEVELYGESKPVRALPENPQTIDYVNSTVDSFNSVTWSGGNYSLLNSIRLLLGGTSNLSLTILVSAVGLVFVWWGVRKTKSIIWTAFRTGRLNLGTSVKRAWYRRKAREWYG